MHELDGLPPVAVCEQQHCLVAAVFQVEGDGRADPFWGAADAAPLHTLVRRELGNFHDGARRRVAEEEAELAAYFGAAFGFGPELGEAVFR